MTTHDKIKEFKANANSIKLYDTGPWVIGVSYINDLYIDSKSEITNYVGEKVELKILGIPVKFSDYVNKVLTMDKNPNNENVKSIELGGF